jgi:hypothetical protein
MKVRLKGRKFYDILQIQKIQKYYTRRVSDTLPVMAELLGLAY